MAMYPFLSVLKAYARDLKAYMKMCNEDENSPAKGKMRQVPLMYAGADVPQMWTVADYLFCDGAHVSIDIFGLNFERWCEDASGKIEQDNLDKLVSEKQFPGAFMLSEMGCGIDQVPDHVRTWNEVPGFFENWQLDGFVAYCYWSSNPNFNMFDGPTSRSTELQDGKNFFANMAKI